MHSLTDIELHTVNGGFSLTYQQRLILRHSVEAPCLWISASNADIDMFRGNFSIKDRLNEKIALNDVTVLEHADGWSIRFSRGDALHATLRITRDEQGRLALALQNDNRDHNGIWLRLAAQEQDHIYGCGEQFSYFNLRGKPFPLWTSEQGVGRKKQSYFTWQADCKENAGGGDYWTFFPQPTFVSSQKYYCHVDNSCYMNFVPHRIITNWRCGKTTPPCASNVRTPTSHCWKNSRRCWGGTGTAGLGIRRRDARHSGRHRGVPAKTGHHA